MNNEMKQIIDKVYENYTQTKIIKTDSGETHISPPGHYNGMAKEQFINKCKTNPEFSETWGLKIEERELSLGERRKLANYDSVFVSPMTVESWDRNNIPTKLITITYNDIKTEIYE